MWANHDRVDQFCPEYWKPGTTWLGSHRSGKDLRRVIDCCVEHRFREPNYRQIDGRPFFRTYRPVRSVDELGGQAGSAHLSVQVVLMPPASSGPPGLASDPASCFS